MKRLILNVILTTSLVCVGFCQDTPQSRPVPRGTSAPQLEADLPKFDLDFPGGTPQQLVEAIQKEIGTLNAIISTEHRNVALPPLKLKSVDVKQLFDALMFASQRTGSITPQPRDFIRTGQTFSESFGFRTTGAITPESIWYFYVQKQEAPEQSKTVRYYQLSRYLTDYKIEDVTTAIQAGWKMLGETENPQLNFHEDTKLLIAAGSISQLGMIDSVLQELAKGLKAGPEHPPGVKHPPGVIVVPPPVGSSPRVPGSQPGAPSSPQ